MSGFTLNNLVFVAVLTITIARNKFSVESFLSKLFKLISETSFLPFISWLSPKIFLYIYYNYKGLEKLIAPSKSYLLGRKWFRE